MSDFAAYLFSQETVRKCRAERENANARLDLAMIEERRREVVSQYEPLATLGLDRDNVQVLLDYVCGHGDMARLKREAKKVKR